MAGSSSSNNNNNNDTKGENSKEYNKEKEEMKEISAVSLNSMHQ